MTSERTIVFISHATPADNAFVRWLGSRLTGHGYRVWADILELRGGTPFWQEIERIIRDEAYVVIGVMSRVSVDPARSGVQNEIALADTVKKKLGRNEFIVPVRLDDVPHADFPIQVHRLNAIDFSAGWGAGLQRLLEDLEKANTPRSTSDMSREFDRWRATMAASATMVEPGKETYLSNILPIRALPERVTFHEANVDATVVSAALRDGGIPHAVHAGRIVMFADLEEFEEHLPAGCRLQTVVRPYLSEFLTGKSKGPMMPRARDARSLVTGILTAELERFLAGRGLQRLETSGGPASYFPKGLLTGDRVDYVNNAGRKTYKQVVGRSEKLNVDWHLGMKLAVKLGDENLVRFRPYVVFSENGAPLADLDRMAAIRRRFCKSWWNPHWRQLYEAFFTFWNKGEAEVSLYLGRQAKFVLDGSPLRFEGMRRMPLDMLVAPEPDDPDEPEDIEDNPADAAADDDIEEAA